MFHRRLILPLVLLLGAAPSVVHASSLSIQTLSFGGIVDSIGATRFDPTLGTLDSVGVTINGAPWNCDGMAVQLPDEELAGNPSIVLNPTGGCD